MEKFAQVKIRKKIRTMTKNPAICFITFIKMIKNFSFPKIWFEPMFLTGSLAVFIGAAPPHFQNFAGGFPRRRRRRNAFGLIQEYSTSKEFASDLGSPRFARRPNCKGFWAKKSVGDFVRGKENFLIKTI